MMIGMWLRPPSSARILLGDRVAVELGQADVEQDQRRRFRLPELERLLPVARDRRPCSRPA